MERSIAILSLILTGIVSSIVLLSLFFTQNSFLYLPYICISYAVLAFLTPRLTIFVFLFALPIFGNRPSTEQSYYFFILACSLNLGLCISLFKKTLQTKLYQELSKPESILVLLCLYVFISLLSLFPIPIIESLNYLKSYLPALGDIPAWGSLVLHISKVTENHLLYPLLSFLWTCLAFNLSIFVLLLSRNNTKTQLCFSSAILLGLCSSILAGLLDYYQFIDLRFFRSLDPIVNSGNIQFRIQSFFGHSGWFAEYITLSFPFVLCLLLLPLRFSLRVAFILTFMVIGEIVLILSYQRGGWLSYPLTLFVIWAAIYIVYQIESNKQNVIDALKKSLGKILICLPLTVGLSLILIFALSSTHILKPQTSVSLENYWQRAKQIQNSSDRTDFMKAGFAIGVLHPIFGAGSESFASAFEREFVEKKGSHFGELNLPLHGTAHNVYFQTLAGKGFVGLFSLLCLVLAALFIWTKAILKNNSLSTQTIITLLIAISSLCAFLIYGNVQEVFYIQPLQYLFFFVFALGITAANLRVEMSARYNSTLWLSVLLLFLAHLFYQAIYPAYALKQMNRPNTWGCYLEEKDEQGETFKWCAKKAEQFVPVINSDNKKYAMFRIKMGFSKFQPNTVSLIVYIENKKVYEQTVSALEEYAIKVPINDEIAKNLEDRVLIRLETASYFIPTMMIPNSDDRRILSYQLK